MMAVVTIGFVKDAKDHVNIQGFNVYHKNRLIKVMIVLLSTVILAQVYVRLHVMIVLYSEVSCLCFFVCFCL